ncbi:MAG: MBL fold metallo-hydrolase [Gammaproteobacteria bacterium]|nr:MBL fold metallo-hydrolase [Gammaproteobacteria bacterium]
MRFSILGSGSRGNGLVVEADGTAILVDCGFNIRETERRLARIGMTPASLSAIVLTHEHSDHVSGAAPLARRYRIPLWATAGTASAITNGAGLANVELREFSAHEPFIIGGLRLEPYPVPHDARDPSQFVFTNGAHRLGLLTDAGHITPHIESVLRPCDALILECNHDLDMLAEGDYPPSLKARIASPQGHLDNDTAAALLARLDVARLQHIVAAHLSEKNNTPWLARSSLESALNGAARRVEIASQEGGLGWRELV